MQQLLILSGKGGTGKTTVASAFIKILQARALADCDVDAPNLHLVINQTIEPRRSDYMGMPKARIDMELCTSCDLCREHCRFNAILYDENSDEYEVDYYACESCAVCEAICPAGAIELYPYVAGDMMLFVDEGVFSTAQLRMGSGTSGLLVTEVKNQMTAAAREDVELAIIDGSPGIGCPVIASLSGVDMVLIVTEPSISGFSDMERIIKTAQQFHTRIAVCINKHDTNPAHTEKIEAFCRDKQLPLAGRIPFDPLAVAAVNRGISIAEIECPSGTAVREVLKETLHILQETEKPGPDAVRIQ